MIKKSSIPRNIIFSKTKAKTFLFFGDDKAVQRLAATRVIHADGTFTCVIPSFAQLYIFHATVENNVSMPVLFCLAKRKNRPTYLRLLGVVEELAREAGLAVFNRDVLFMCDFEQAMIKTMQQHYPSVTIECCFFHFSQSVRKNAVEAIQAVAKTAGDNVNKIWMVKKAVRRIMMLPLVPEELITPELVQFIIESSTDDPKKLPWEFKAFTNTLLKTYVGKRRVLSGPIVPPRYPLALWNVS